MNGTPHTPELDQCSAAIGERVKSARLAAGLSLRDMAPLLGVSAMALSKWERGLVPFSSQRLIAIGNVTNRKASWFMEALRPKVTLSAGHCHREARP